jgi:WD40 repeat protein
MTAATSTSASRLARVVVAFLSLALFGLFTLDRLPASAQEDKKALKEKEKEKDKDKKEVKEEKKEPIKLDEPLQSFKGHSDWINALSYSQDGKYLASAGRDRTVRLWDSGSGKDVQVLKDHPQNVKAVAFLPEGNRIVSTTGKWNKEKKVWQGEVKIWDAKAGKVVTTYIGHEDTIEALAISRDGKRLATGSEDKTIIVWDTAGKPVHTLKGHGDKVLSVAFDKDGKKLVSSSADGIVMVWDADTGKELAKFKFPPVPEEKKPEPKKEEPKKAEPKKEEPKKVEPPKKKDEPKKEEPKKEEPKKKAKDKKKKEKEPPKKEVKTEPPKPDVRPVTSVAFSPDGSRIAAGSLDGTIKILDSGGKDLFTLKGPEGVWAVAFSPDGKHLATAGWDVTIKIWDLQSRKAIRSITASEKTITSLVFSPDGQRLASGGLDHLIRIWAVKK